MRKPVNVAALVALAGDAGNKLDAAQVNFHALEDLFSAIRCAVRADSNLVLRLAEMGRQFASDYAGDAEDAAAVCLVDLENMTGEVSHA